MELILYTIYYISIAIIVINTIISFLNFIYIKIIFKREYEKLAYNSDFLVSILIPARNEEKNILRSIESILNQDYKNIEIIVYDDQSEDKTSYLIEKFYKDKVKLIKGSNLEKGFIGKNFACYKLSQISKGDYLLFMDADVEIHNKIIYKLIALSEKYNFELISIFPYQIMKSFGEKISVPIIYYLLLSLLPLFLVDKVKNPLLSAANGQLMFFKAKTYKKLNPHYIFKSSTAEDIDIAKFYKKNNLKIACFTGIKDVQCRMYNDLKDCINGLSKNIIQIFLNNSIFAITFSIITTFGFLTALIMKNYFLLILYFIIFLLNRLFVYITSNISLLPNLMISYVEQLLLIIIVFNSIINRNRLKWKGRDI